MADKTQPQGISRRRATEDDVEGHIHRARVTEGEGISRRRETEDDVEGHIHHARASEGIAHPKATEDDDVEGHSLMDPFAARQLSQARERDVQQHLKRREFEQDARAAKKDHR
jgi:hypothetical protein